MKKISKPSSNEIIDDSLQYLQQQRSKGLNRRINSSAPKPPVDPGTHRYCQSVQILNQVNSEVKSLLGEIKERERQQIEREQAIDSLLPGDSESERLKEESEMQNIAETAPGEVAESPVSFWHTLCCSQFLRRCCLS